MSIRLSSQVRAVVVIVASTLVLASCESFPVRDNEYYDLIERDLRTTYKRYARLQSRVRDVRKRVDDMSSLVEACETLVQEFPEYAGALAAFDGQVDSTLGFVSQVSKTRLSLEEFRQEIEEDLYAFDGATPYQGYYALLRDYFLTPFRVLVETVQREYLVFGREVAELGNEIESVCRTSESENLRSQAEKLEQWISRHRRLPVWDSSARIDSTLAALERGFAKDINRLRRGSTLGAVWQQEDYPKEVLEQLCAEHSLFSPTSLQNTTVRYKELEDEDFTVFLSQVNIRGNTVVNHKELMKVIADAGVLNTRINSTGLALLRQLVTRAYVDRGYITSGASIPDQEIEGGIISIDVVEGRLGSVEVYGVSARDELRVRSHLQRRLTTPLNYLNLQDVLSTLVMEAWVGRLVADLQPSDLPGEAHLSLEIRYATDLDLIGYGQFEELFRCPRRSERPLLGSVVWSRSSDE